MALSMLGHVVTIAIAKDPEQRIQPTPRRKLHTDLEIDQVGQAIVSDNDVFLLMQINISDASLMEEVDQLFHAIKKFLGQIAAQRQGFPVNKYVSNRVLCNLAIDSNVVVNFGDTFEVLQFAQEIVFSMSEESP
jgi:hypothetical protein